MMKPLWINLLSLSALCAAAFALLLGGPARADSWAMPETEVTLAAGGAFRFTVTPGDLEPPPPGSDRDKVAAQTDGQPAERLVPRGLLEKRNAKGEWEPVWARSLVNRTAPVTVLVADNGRHVVTLDNWGSLGHGAHVIVIYGPDGGLVRSLALNDLVPEDYMMALPRSVSSIYWRKDEGFSADGVSVVIPMIVPQGGGLGDEVETVPFTIALADGTVTMPPPAQWEGALAATAKVTAAMAAAEAEFIAYRTAPLVPPQGCEEQVWHEYLREAYARLSIKPLFEGSTATTVLFPRDHPRHRESVKWLRDEMADVWDFPTNASFASPCDPDGLVAAFSKAVKRLKPGTAVNVTFYIAAPAPQYTEIPRLIAPSGAKAVWLDPAIAIPQRHDRIPGSPEAAAAIEAYFDGFAAQMPED